jgi:hypothetical protein
LKALSGDARCQAVKPMAVTPGAGSHGPCTTFMPGPIPPVRTDASARWRSRLGRAPNVGKIYIRLRRIADAFRQSGDKSL